MGTFDLLEKLRTKPEPVRHLIAFWSSVLLTVIVASIWLSHLTGSIAGKVAGDKQAPPVFESIKSSWNNLIANTDSSYTYER